LNWPSGCSSQPSVGKRTVGGALAYANLILTNIIPL
jgi:hypothetical protein